MKPMRLVIGNCIITNEPVLSVPERRARRGSFRQCDVVRAIRAAQAAGLKVREIAPDGRLILGEPVQQAPEPNGMAKDAVHDVVADRLRLIYGSR